MNIEGYKTLTGIPWDKIPAELDKPFPKEAYQTLNYEAELTSIKAPYMFMLLTEIFGPCGLGWGYEYDADDMEITLSTYKDRNGYARNRYVSTLKRLAFFYYLTSDQGANDLKLYIRASGAAINSRPDYAMKGAITSAISNAVSKLLFQISIYMDKEPGTVLYKSTNKAVKETKPEVKRPYPPAVFKENMLQAVDYYQLHPISLPNNIVQILASGIDAALGSKELRYQIFSDIFGGTGSFKDLSKAQLAAIAKASGRTAFDTPVKNEFIKELKDYLEFINAIK